MSTQQAYVPLHLHSEYSLLDGAIRVKNPSEIIEILSKHSVYHLERQRNEITYDLFNDDKMIVADASGEYSEKSKQ